eukprot:CAMPEP_0176277794 /NCGR_PEP_ID=MMETSP0121_2-20121125/48461_1 /TAXON_ID=160619 /ORGANISM="Kryptoperidinium foliaceum, Strain CCMP 1326" /LENGTH=36 /DNA_ID= /DNA_START= /DNA_END= /DNA_ORIENTATION=
MCQVQDSGDDAESGGAQRLETGASTAPRRESPVWKA